ncbi:hypothetical protein M409DRAFT_19415 [Zasmidium cellare ATCC 36951]|uniref:Uncharacterized protein n=1 Tax=Zasmidium cellare ATCC 36951 TaxID=1080233 RepID=A0A6A6CWL7_ZASCE|nr:uncharacterized protein M409DRAFT_19415 [Zasmidium cellare ATCC 36951]KAF2170598.1 hypothetical protein M409DRAFT_19415 [Zasmidium cellare ATCC 36951]
MPTRPIYLLKIRPSPRQRAHFCTFIPYPEHASHDPSNKAEECRGTKIHVIGTPLAMSLQFQSNFPCHKEHDLEAVVRLGDVDDSLIVDIFPTKDEGGRVLERTEPSGRLEREATSIRPPRGGNVLALVDDVTNRRCQEWTMDYLRHLVKKGLLDASAVDIAQAERDPPGFGIGLRPVGGEALW